MNPNPQQTLEDLKQLLKEGAIKKDQVLALLPQNEDSEVTKKTKAATRINLQIILYYIGTLIILTGIVVLIAQYWHDMSQVFKIMLTATFAISAYSLGYYFYVTQKKQDIGHAFFTISAFVFPLAIGTTLDGIGIHASQAGGAVVNSALMFTIFMVSYSSLKAKIFLPFSIAAATALYFTGIHYIVMDVNKPLHLAQYEALTIGISYLLVAYYLKMESRLIMNLMFFIGSVAILSSTMSLAGFSPGTNLLWEVAYPFILSAMIALSIKIQNKTILVVATLFTFGEILKITAEYFSQSIGWPISLILAGLIIMGIGYTSFEINKKYIKSETA